MQKKRRYTKPNIESHNIDQEICLAMDSNNTPPDDPWGTPAAAASSEAPQQSSALEENPFDENNLQ